MSRSRIYKQTQSADNRLKAKENAKHVDRLLKKKDNFNPFYFIVSVNGNKHQLMACMLLLLIANAYANNAGSHIQNHASYKSSKNTMIAGICKNSSIQAFNHPNISLGAINNKIVPLACAQELINECKIQTDLVNSFYKNRNIILDKQLNIFLKVRQEGNIEHNSWIQSFRSEADKILDTMNKQQRVDFSQMCFMLGKFTQITLSEHLVKESGIGNCAEQINAGLKNLLIKKMKYGLKLRIQLVILDATHLKNKNIIQDHRFLLLDSNLNDVQIKQNHKAVKELLSTINKGHYCDPWNRFYENTNANPRIKSLYTGEAGWHSAELQTLEIDFKKINSLPPEAQKFICKKLSDMGLPMKEIRKKICRANDMKFAEETQPSSSSEGQFRPEF